jgi:ribosomal protein L12E/L44/L45/RPP1/RPP2
MTSGRAMIDIDPEALRILEALAALEGVSPSDYLSALITREGARIPEAHEATEAKTAEESREREKIRKEAEARWREFRRTKIGD